MSGSYAKSKKCPAAMQSGNKGAGRKGLLALAETRDAARRWSRHGGSRRWRWSRHGDAESGGIAPSDVDGASSALTDSSSRRPRSSRRPSRAWSAQRQRQSTISGALASPTDHYPDKRILILAEPPTPMSEINKGSASRRSQPGQRVNRKGAYATSVRHPQAVEP